MQEFFFEVGLQDKWVITYDLYDKWMTSFNHVNFSLKNTISFQNVQ